MRLWPGFTRAGCYGQLCPGGDMVRSKRPRSYRSGVGPAVLAQTLLPVVASVSVAQAAIDREEFRFVLWIIAGAVVVGTSFALCL
jgi:hypothetical protein